MFDVAIIGAGAVGAAIARELARYELNSVLVDAAPDVGMGTSKASTAIWHTGFDAKPGSLESKLLRRSYPLMAEFFQQANVPVERLGALLIAWNEEQFNALPSLLEKAHANGVTEVAVVDAAEIYRREPHLKPGALGGLWVLGEGILCTYTIPLACATQAVLNGTTLKLNFPVEQISQENGAYTLRGAGGAILARFVVNAAGLYSDEIHRRLGHATFIVTPRRGELIIFDKLARSLVNHVLLPVPTAKTKGVLISPTVYGNILLGPTAEDLPDKTNTATSAAGLQSLLEKGRAILPALLDEEVTATYAGLRAATEHSDYQIHLHAEQRYVCVGGIRSTGVSAALGIAEYVAELLGQAGLALRRKAEFKPVQMPNIGEANQRPYQSSEKIAKDARFGHIVCHCERVTLGEIVEAAHAVIPARTVDGLRRRTRVLQGRCQGFNCYGAVVATLARESGRAIHDLLNLTMKEQRHKVH